MWITRTGSSGLSSPHAAALALASEKIECLNVRELV
jgi:hypothetical protein